MSIKTIVAAAAMIVSGAVTTNAQKAFTLDELFPGSEAYTALRPENMNLRWWGTVPVKLTKEEAVDVLTGQSICAIEEKAGKVSFPDDKNPYIEFYEGKRHVIKNFQTGDVVWEQTLPDEAMNEDFSEKSRHTAYTIKGNLYVLKSNGERVQVSTDGSMDGSEAILYGASVHRDEFGISKGTFWSPDGQMLAFYRMDQSMVPSYPQVDITTRIATTQVCRYPMAGEKSHEVKVGIYDVKEGKTIWLNLVGAKDDYHTNLSWAPDGKTLYVFEVNRDQNDMRLVAYDTKSGEVIRTILQEEHPKYVEPQTGLTFLPWDGQKAVFQSQRDGYNHLYLLDLNPKKVYKEPEVSHFPDGGVVKEYATVHQLTRGRYVVQELVGFNEVSHSIIFRANETDPRQSTLFAINAKGGKMKPLGDQKGVHQTPLLNEDGTQILDTYTAPDVPRKIELVSTATGKGQTLLLAADTWAEHKQPEITSGSIKAADGETDLYYRMVKPVDFDPKKQYPTVIYVYGGPHAHNVDASWHWGLRAWEAYMAQEGYLLFILDNRGSEWRGRNFENATFRQLGVVEREDQYEGVKFLQSLPYVDKDRMGVHGWSYGGYMTIGLMLHYPEVFKVGVAGGPVIDWHYYEVMYGERYMDSPEQNPEGYEKCDLKKKAGDLRGRLQIIIGGNDPVVVPQHALSFLRACEDASTQPDFFVYPGDEHNMFGKDRIHLHERITRYFNDYLK